MAESFKAVPPHYDSMLEWVQSRLDQGDTGARYRKILDPLTIFNGSPVAVEPFGLQPHSEAFWSIRKFEVPEAYVAVVPGGFACGDGWRSRSAILTPDRNLIWDASSMGVPAPRAAEEHWVFKDHELPDPTLIPEPVAFMVTQPSWDRNYHHWMFGLLPRLHLLWGSGFPVSKYVMSPLLSEFQHETLATLGLDEELIIPVEHHFCISASELIFPSEAALVLPAWACAFLRRAFLDRHSPPVRTNERLYVSRLTVGYRHIANEDEISEVLAKFRFREFIPDGMTVAEQARTFASASCVLGPHGGALTNLVFCPPQTKVFELFSPRYVQPSYWMLSNQCNLRYHYLVGRGERPPIWAWPTSDGGADSMEIDPDQLVSLLRRAGL